MFLVPIFRRQQQQISQFSRHEKAFRVFATATPLLLDGESVRRRSSPQDSTKSIMYKPLDPKAAEIRLLTLQPGQFNEDVRCSLHTVSLTSGPRYRALSYVWGDPDKTLPVIVDGSEIRVTTNLEAALRHLRRRKNPRTLWVDAICLDQDNVEEKGIQVPMMGGIYRQATTVIAWLGHGLEPVEGAIKWAKNYASRQASEKSPGSEDAVSFPGLDPLGFSVLVPGLLYLLKHCYWHRMWTYQEFVLATNMPVCVYGHFEFPLSTIVEAFKAFTKESKSILKLAQSLDEEFKPAFDTTRNELLEFGKDMTVLRNLMALSDPSSRGHSMQISIQQNTIAFLFSITAGRESSNPRDRIYALCGLNPYLSRTLHVDYSKTERQVILEAIALMVLQGDLGILWGVFELQTDRFSCVRRFPSWTPNLNRCKPDPIREHDHALGSSGLAIEADHLAPDLTTLHLWAWNMGYCKVLQRIDCREYEDVYSGSVAMVIHKLSAFVEELWANDVHSTDHGLCKKLARLSVANVEGHEQASDDELVEAFRAVRFDASLAEEDQDGKFESRGLGLVAQAGRQIENVACIITSKGYVGFGPLNTEDNDLVVFPRNPALPIVLRKSADWRQLRRESYLMVGVATVNTAAGAKGDDSDNVVSKVQELSIAKYILH